MNSNRSRLFANVMFVCAMALIAITLQGICPTAAAGDTVTVSGTVTLTTDGLAVTGATVSSSTGPSTTTDGSGNYSLSLTEGVECTLSAKAPGTAAFTTTVTPASGMAAVDFALLLRPATATYYVSPSGSDSGPGTSGQPWKSIDNGDKLGILEPGDAVIVKAGRYTGVQSIAGVTPVSTVWLKNCYGDLRFGGLITYKAEVSALANPSSIVDGGSASVTDTNGTHTRLVAFYICGPSATGAPAGNAQGIAIDGFAITGAVNGVVMDGTSSIEVKNCYIHDMWNENNTGDAMGIWANACAGKLFIHNNVMYNIGQNLPALGTQAGVYMTNDTNTDDSETIAQNDFVNLAYGLYFNDTWVAHYIKVYNNIFVNAWKYGEDFAPNGSVYPGTGSTSFQSWCNLFHNCYWERNFTGWSMDYNGDPLFVDADNPPVGFQFATTTRVRNGVTFPNSVAINTCAINSGGKVPNTVVSPITGDALTYIGSFPDRGAYESDMTNQGWDYGYTSLVIGTVTNSLTGALIERAKVDKPVVSKCEVWSAGIR